MKTWLTRPYPFLYEQFAIRLQIAICIGLFIFSFLSIFQPFNFRDIVKINVYLAAFYYALLSAVVFVSTTSFIIRVFPNYFNDKTWNIGKEMLSMNIVLVAISLANGLLGYQIEACPADEINTIWGAISRNLMHTYSIGIFPVMTLTGISYTIFLRRNLTKAAQINKKIKARSTDNQTELNPEITIQSPANNNDFTIRLNDLIFIMSDGNYVEFHIEDHGNVRREIRRNTLSNIESQLATYDHLFRSHRAYLVNLKKVIQSSGNAQGYELKFNNTEHSVPVSRRNLSRFAELIKN